MTSLVAQTVKHLPTMQETRVRSLGGACSARTTGGLGLIPGLGRAFGGGNDNPLQYSFLENPMNKGAWWATVIGS